MLWGWVVGKSRGLRLKNAFFDIFLDVFFIYFLRVYLPTFIQNLNKDIILSKVNAMFK